MATATLIPSNAAVIMQQQQQNKLKYTARPYMIDNQVINGKFKRLI